MHEKKRGRKLGSRKEKMKKEMMGGKIFRREKENLSKKSNMKTFEL